MFPLAILIGVCISIVAGWLLSAAPGIVHIASGTVSGVLGFIISEHLIQKDMT